MQVANAFFGLLAALLIGQAATADVDLTAPFAPGTVRHTASGQLLVILAVNDNRLLALGPTHSVDGPVWLHPAVDFKQADAVLSSRGNPYESVLVPRYGMGGTVIYSYAKHAVAYLVRDESMKEWVVTSDWKVFEIGTPPNVALRRGETPSDALKAIGDSQIPVYLATEGRLGLSDLMAQASATDEADFGARRAVRAVNAGEGAGTKIDPREILREVAKEK